jgi:hypothetical protein
MDRWQDWLAAHIPRTPVPTRESASVPRLAFPLFLAHCISLLIGVVRDRGSMLDSSPFWSRLFREKIAAFVSVVGGLRNFQRAE